ncbi:WAP four-disulfide core domain protein 1 isoform X2 [Dasypus novemcinctus]|uniref:WAP four-disulfide core domain protein 1 isoform X2 n=1 Tax=Dasypus novemcinctus TaxID=9361 RepID=UPI00265F0C7F|nr:WAP four-disulfide core domain protein 1 isoform X2 [Dasypus novemcinctus]
MPLTGPAMGSRRGKLVWALCFLLLRPAAASVKDLWKRTPHASLGEESRVEDRPRQPHADRCPPPPQTLPPDACQAARCLADSACSRLKRCCYNGCAYTCLEAVPPPPEHGLTFCVSLGHLLHLPP